MASLSTKVATYLQILILVHRHQSFQSWHSAPVGAHYARQPSLFVQLFYLYSLLIVLSKNKPFSIKFYWLLWVKHHLMKIKGILLISKAYQNSACITHHVILMLHVMSNHVISYVIIPNCHFLFILWPTHPSLFPGISLYLLEILAQGLH